MTQFGHYPAPLFTIAHLSDPHLLSPGRLQYGAIDSEAHLRRTLDRLRLVTPTPDVLVFTGDLADLGEPEAYARLRALVEPLAADFGAQVVLTMGNHDERPAYSLALFGEASDAAQDRVYDVEGLRIVALDTSVPGYHHGDLSTDQLAWLADVLATPAGHGTILAMHHPPIPVPMCEVAVLMELRSQDRLADVLAGTDVRAILAGHFHFDSHSTFAGIPITVASASCYTADLAPGPDLLFAGVEANQSFSMVHVYDDRVVHTIVPVASGPIVTQTEMAMRALAETIPVDELRELASRKDSPLHVGE